MSSNTRAGRIEAALRAAFQPTALTITDNSARHAGHHGMAGQEVGETHFSIAMTSAGFAGLSRVARSRLVHETLEEELAHGLHALSLSLLSPQVDTGIPKKD